MNDYFAKLKWSEQQGDESSLHLVDFEDAQTALDFGRKVFAHLPVDVTYLAVARRGDEEWEICEELTKLEEEPDPQKAFQAWEQRLRGQTKRA